MRIARVLAKLEPGGAQLALLRLMQALTERGHESLLFVGTATTGGVQVARAHGVEPVVQGLRTDVQWTADKRFAAWLEPRLRADFDLVHAHMFGGWWAAARAVPDGVPLVASEHNSYLWPGEPAWDALADAARRVERFYVLSPGARADLVACGVAPERIARGLSAVVGFDSRERPGLPKPRIVYTGRLAADKGPDVLVEAIGLMASPPPVLMLGSGAMDTALRARIAALGLGDVVRLAGWTDAPGTWVAGASVQAIPSRDEAFSQTAVLAMGLGVPVVGTRVDGFPATLADGRGVIVEPEDPEGLARALEDVLAGRRLPDLDGARRWAAQFTPQRVADAYETDYRRLLAAVTAA